MVSKVKRSSKNKGKTMKRNNKGKKHGKTMKARKTMKAGGKGKSMKKRSNGKKKRKTKRKTMKGGFMGVIKDAIVPLLFTAAVIKKGKKKN